MLRQTVSTRSSSRVASIGEMHLTFNQGIKARLLGGSLEFILARKRQTCARRPFPFAPFHLGCKHTRRCSRLLTGRTRFESWASQDFILATASVAFSEQGIHVTGWTGAAQ